MNVLIQPSSTSCLHGRSCSGAAGRRPALSLGRLPHRHRQAGLRCRAAFTLTDSKTKEKRTIDKAQCAVGSGASCDVRVTGAQVAESHALILSKGKQVFLKALVGESMLDDSRCWKDGVQLRPGVQYVLASGSVLAFGAEGQAYTIEFEEGTGSNPLVEMMMKGMAASSGNADVKKALNL